MTTGGLLVHPDRAMAQRARDRTDPEPPIFPPPVDPPKPPPGRQQPTRYFGVVELDPQSYALAFKKIHDEILSHLAVTPGVRMTLRLDIEADTPDGFDESRVRTISENGTVLGFDQSGFETR